MELSSCKENVFRGVYFLEKNPFTLLSLFVLIYHREEKHDLVSNFISFHQRKYMSLDFGC